MVKKTKLWVEFEGLENTNEVLSKKAFRLAELIVYFSMQAIDILINDIARSNSSFIAKKAPYYDVVNEVLVFFIHYSDRIAFSILDTSQREYFINNLMAGVSEELPLVCTLDADKRLIFQDDLKQMYDERIVEYGGYKKILPQEGEGLKNTLFWEFEVKLAELLGCKKNIQVIYSVHEYVVSASVTLFVLQDLLSEPNSVS